MHFASGLRCRTELIVAVDARVLARNLSYFGNFFSSRSSHGTVVVIGVGKGAPGMMA